MPHPSQEKFTITIIYALAAEQKPFFYEATAGDSIEQAIRQCGILAHYPEIDLSTQAVGIFSKKRKLTDGVRPGDRIEIYRSLNIDPKQARLLRSKKRSRSKH